MQARARRTKMNTTEKPMASPASIGAQNEIVGYDVHPNQKNETAKIGAAITAIFIRFSGGTIFGLYSSIRRSY